MSLHALPIDEWQLLQLDTDRFEYTILGSDELQMQWEINCRASAQMCSSACRAMHDATYLRELEFSECPYTSTNGRFKGASGFRLLAEDVSSNNIRPGDRDDRKEHPKKRRCHAPHW
jgi:hypothetical protein